jgi:hypothetical protein
VSIDESGNVTGVPEYLTSWLTTLGSQAGEAPKPADQGRVPRKPDAKAGDPNDRFAKLNTFNELLVLGPTAVAECYEKYPETYARLKAAQSKGLEAPARVMFGQPPNPAHRSN